jgi:serine/threonine-protein kinase
VLEPERQALYARPTDNLEAYDLLMRASEQWDKSRKSEDRQDYQKIIQLTEKAIELDPNCALAYVWLSHGHRILYWFGYDQTEDRLKKWKDAIDKALELQSDMPEAHQALAYYYYQGLLDYDRALERVEYVQRVRPNNSPSLLAFIQRRQGNIKQSIINLEKAFKLNPQDVWNAYEIGANYMDLRSYDKAEFWLNRALTINPDFLNAQITKANLYKYSKGDTKKSQDFLESIPKTYLSDISWFRLCLMERNYSEAIDRLNALSFKIQESQNTCFHKDLALASVYHAQKELSLTKIHAESARADLERAVQEHPQDPRYRSALGFAYAYLGMKDRAIGEGKYATELYPVSKDALQGPYYIDDMARIYALVGNYEEAIEQLEYLMSIPAGGIVSVHSLRLDPIWDPLREHPRFQQLLEKYSEEEEPVDRY